MPISAYQRTIWERSRAPGSGGQAIRLGDEDCLYLIGRIVHDLNIQEQFQDIPPDVPEFFNTDIEQILAWTSNEIDPYPFYERLVTENTDSDTYYECLSKLYKTRFKYQQIIESQPLPTLEQVGPRGLLQYGKLGAAALVGFLYWRKWFFDIDNRAGQETGYLFEPIITSAVGGISVPAKESPVRRARDPAKARQIDCLRDDVAYEIKVRVTIAASGQGRWREEIEYPMDCRESGFTPALIVLDGTPNPKLEELSDAFLRQGGEVHDSPPKIGPRVMCEVEHIKLHPRRQQRVSSYSMTYAAARDCSAIATLQ